jgi:uncharacterized protein (TIGR03066 family)
MRTLFAAVLGGLGLGLGGPAAAADDKDDFAKKIVGKWEITKAGGDVGPGSTLDFAKDGKLVLLIKEDDGKREVKGSYKLTKDKLTVTLKVGEDESFDQTLTIKKLTDDALELEDENKMTDVLKKKREA